MNDLTLFPFTFPSLQMQNADFLEKWTRQELLDELDTVELFEAPGHGRVLGEITKKQEKPYAISGVKPFSL